MKAASEQGYAEGKATRISNPGSLKLSPEQETNTLLKEGKSAAITINTPFTVIPGLPALNKILARIDRTTQQDLGFTFKASAARTPNGQGEKDLLLNLDYIGFGWMSSKFNVQFSPVSIKVESGEFNRKPHWGCNFSVLSSPMGLVHERAGVKGTFNDCNGTRTFSAAPEISYQVSKTFKPLSTATGGLFFGDSGTFRIPAAYVPSLQRIQEASPNLEEWKTIAEHVSPSIPAVQIGKLIEQDIEVIGNIADTAIASTKSAIESIAKLEAGGVNLLTHTRNTAATDPNKAGDSMPVTQKLNQEKPALKINLSEKYAAPGIEPSNEEKASYTVQKNDTLSMIAKKTGCLWTEILALNKAALNGNPDRIYPGQELIIPDHNSHSALIRHPAVKAQILANMLKHEQNQSEQISGTASNPHQTNEIG